MVQSNAEAGWAGGSCQAGHGLWQELVFYASGGTGLLVAVRGSIITRLFITCISDILSAELVPLPKPPSLPGLSETYRHQWLHRKLMTHTTHMHVTL